MKRNRKFVSLLLGLCLSMVLMTPCFAATEENKDLDLLPTESVAIEEQTEEATEVEGTIEPKAATVPNAYKNLSSGDYTAELIDLAATKSSMTKYYFTTGTGKINLSLDLVRSGTTEKTMRVLKVYLYSRASDGIWTDTGLNRTITFYGTEFSDSRFFSGLDTDKFYYLKFTNESATNSSARMDISGEILITE